MIETAVSESLLSIALSALATLIAPADPSAEAEYLRQHQAQINGQPDLLANALRNPHPADEQLLGLARELRLSQIEVLATALAAAVETDLMCGRVLAHLQAPVGASRPTLGLVADAFRSYAQNRDPIAAILTGAAVESGLLQISVEGAPLAERFLSVPVPICIALRGDSGEGANWQGTVTAFDDSQTIVLPPSILATAARHARALSTGDQRTLLLRCGSTAEAKAVAVEIARRTGRRALFLDGGISSTARSGLAPWLLLRNMLPVFLFSLGPGERKVLPTLLHYNGPRLAICGIEGSLEADTGTIPDWTIGIVAKEERAALWESALGSKDLAAALSSHRHGSGRIAQLGSLSRHQSLLDGRYVPNMADVLAASWTAEGGGLDALAQPLRDAIPDDALIMTPGLRTELNRLLLRCRRREGLADSLGPSSIAKYRPGFRALFTGPSGTGKTLASGWLATHLGLPLYRVDLAAVTSKYIGETEKNLAQLLARAEHSEVILLFDEADSIFGKRTEVKESNDRFANAQTNYLLQRIESFDGIVFLTSNSRSRFDPAFFRRLDAIIEFPIPGPAERRYLWQSHLGSSHQITPRELNQLSATADLLGGNIRNAVLTAAALAQAEDQPIHYRHLLEGLTDEYKKLGRNVPSELQKNA